MKRWKSPITGVVISRGRVFRPGHDVRRIAWLICEQAWKGLGVRVFCWPCGTVAVIPVDSAADARLERMHCGNLFATYCRDASRHGPQMVDVIHDLNWARHACPHL